MDDHATNRHHLVTSAYATGANLAARQSIYRFQQPQLHFADWVLAQTEWSGVIRAVDVGCGNGAHLQRLAGRVPQLLGLDLSVGMLADAARVRHSAAGFQLAAADAQALPLRDRSVDAVLAMHMLYHVPDIPRAAQEFRRILRPGGVLLAATNGAAHLQQLIDLYAAIVSAVGGTSQGLLSSFTRFTAENGADVLRTAFDQVEWRPAVSMLVVPEPGPVIEYLGSTRGWMASALPASVTWEDCMAHAERIVGEQISRDGAFRVSTVAGVFVCR